MSCPGFSLFAAAKMDNQAKGRDVQRGCMHGGFSGLTDNGPETVLFSNVVGSGTERFLTADGQSAGIHQVSEELPSGWNFEHLETLGLGHAVDRLGRGHGSGETLDTVLEVRDRLFGPVGDNSDGIRGSDESAGAVNHVSVTIAVGSGTKDDLLVFDGLDEVVRVRQVRIRVGTAKVGFRDAVLARGSVEAEDVAEDGLSVWAGDTVEGVEEDSGGLAVVRGGL